MRLRFPTRLLGLAAGAALALQPGARGAPAELPPAAPTFDFERDVRPLVEGACTSCHGETKQRGAFRMDTRAGLMKGGNEGAAIVPGKSAESPLIKYVARLVPDLEMPPENEHALSAKQVGILRAWIDAGAAYPGGGALKTPVAVSAEISAAAIATLPAPAARRIDFVKDVQPLFARSCLGCHGPSKQESALRLDHKATVMRGGDLGPILVPGKSAESALIHFVAGLRPEGAMPKQGARLSRDEIGVLRAWIDQGAAFPDAASVVLKDRRDHWAWKPVVRPAVPAVADARGVRTPVDAFVRARLARDGLAPAPEADKVALLRRLYLDLIGLPPTPAEAQAFLADAAPGAYDRLVERLLASPHYGERWGRHWLDAARYADTDGFEKDKTRFMWFYRDWVVSAFNRDLPYDQFVIEQIAGDLLPHPTTDQIAATGFLRNSMINEEGGADPEQFRTEAMFDRMDAVGRAVLGLTIGCAQCHTHKFDPITQTEYYRMFAFLNNDNEASPAVYTTTQEAQRAAVMRKIAAEEAALKRAVPAWRAQMAAWEARVRGEAQPAWTSLQAPFDDESTGGARYLPQKDGAFLVQGFAPGRHTAKMVVKTETPSIGAFRLELLTDPNLPMGGPGRSIKGTCALTEFMVEAAPADRPEARKKVKFVRATADFEQKEQPLEALFPNRNENEPKKTIGPVAFAIDGKDDTAWTIDAGPGRRNVDRQAVFVPEAPIANPQGTILTIQLRQTHGGWNSDDNHTNSIGRFRLSITPAEKAAADVVPARVRAVLAIPAAKRTAVQADAIFSAFRAVMPGAAARAANARIEALWAQHPHPTTTLALVARAEPRETHVFKRGDWLKPGRIVSPGVPAFLNPLPAGAPPTRLTFARWMVDPQAPTTARAFVNRVWQAYFGTGLVATSEDLGTQAEPPSHPELLDYLAAEFMARGWRVKDLHRMIVKSATYRQSSVVTAAALARDPQNRLLARAPRLRVEGEIVRDVFLASSGLLDARVGGESVMPPAPAFLFLPPVSYGPFPWIEAKGGERYRRALYTFRRRSTPYPMLQTFDTPAGDASCVRRVRSNTPLQALTTLNETLSMEAAQALARRMWESGGRDDASRLSNGFMRVLSRPATEAESGELVGLLERQRARIADGWMDAWLLAGGKAELPEKLPGGATPADLAAYTLAARVILNMDEAITKE